MVLGLRSAAALCGWFVLCVSPMVNAEWLSDQQDIMGTRVSVNLWHDDAEKGRAAVGAVMDEFKRLDQLLSPYKAGSELSQFNRQAGQGEVSISSELAVLIDKALYYGRISEGAFDITFASLGQHYDYRQSKAPSAAQFDELVEAIDYRHVSVDLKSSRASLANAKVRIDLGGIAKGYAVDRAVAIVREFGVSSGNISAGGDSRVLGDKRGKPWIVGIKNPRNDEAMAILLPLDNIAISTSGDYERYFFDAESGERIHHILNPRTGESASGIASASVIGPQGFDTDPLSTTVFVLGVDKGLALINRLPGFDAVLIDSRGKVHYSDGLQDP